MKTENKIKAWTYFDGTDEDVIDFIREWETLLETSVSADLTSNPEGKELWYCETFATQDQVEEFFMDRDWFTI
jgi:hypothetical protein